MGWVVVVPAVLVLGVVVPVAILVRSLALALALPVLLVVDLVVLSAPLLEEALALAVGVVDLVAVFAFLSRQQ